MKPGVHSPGSTSALGYTPVIASVDAAHLKVDGIPPLPQSRDRVVWCFLRNDIAEAHGLPDLRPTCDAMCPTCGPVEGVQRWRKNPDFPVGEYGRKSRQYYYVCPSPRCGAYVEPVTRGIGDVIDPSVRGDRFGDGWFDRFKRAYVPYVQATRDRVAIGLAKACSGTLRSACLHWLFAVTWRNAERITVSHSPGKPFGKASSRWSSAGWARGLAARRAP